MFTQPSGIGGAGRIGTDETITLSFKVTVNDPVSVASAENVASLTAWPREPTSFESNSVSTRIQGFAVTVTFDPQEGSLANTTASYRTGETPLTLPTPVRPGYTFLGWFTQSAGGTQVESPYTPENSLTLYAQWEKKTNNADATILAKTGGQTRSLLIAGLTLFGFTSVALGLLAWFAGRAQLHTPRKR